MYIGILVNGEFNLFDYSLHTLNNVFQSAALAIVIKEWAFVITVLRQHSSAGVGGNRQRDSSRSGTGNEVLLPAGTPKTVYDSTGEVVLPEAGTSTVTKNSLV